VHSFVSSFGTARILGALGEKSNLPNNHNDLKADFGDKITKKVTFVWIKGEECHYLLAEKALYYTYRNDKTFLQPAQSTCPR